MAGGGDAGPPGVVEEPRLRAGRWAGARGWIEDFSTAPGAQPTAFVLDRSFVGWEFGWGRAMGSRLDGRGPGNRSGAGGTAAGAPTTPFLDAVLRAAGRSSGEVKIARRRCTARCPPLQVNIAGTWDRGGRRPGPAGWGGRAPSSRAGRGRTQDAWPRSAGAVRSGGLPRDGSRPGRSLGRRSSEPAHSPSGRSRRTRRGIGVRDVRP